MYITPGRTSVLTLDVDETAVIDPGFSVYRAGADIAKRSVEGTANAGEHTQVKFWASGVWTLEPLQYDISNIQETSNALGYVIRASGWSFVQVLGPGGNQPMFVESAKFAQDDLTGSVYASTVPTSGDFYMKAAFPAGASCNPADVSANSTFDSLGPTAIPYENSDVAMDRVAVSGLTYLANQGFFLRWSSFAPPGRSPRFLFSFLFGQYAVTIAGSGFAYLWEYCEAAGSSTFRWMKRGAWQFASGASSPGFGAHSMGIFPHRSPDGTNYIVFSDVSSDRAPQNNTREAAGANSAVVGEHVYKSDPTVRGTDQDASPGSATSQNKIRLDLRRGLRLDIQVSKLAFFTGGTLIDDCSIVGNGVWTGNTNALTGTINAVTDSINTITGTTLDAVTGTAFVPGTSVFPESKFVFAGNGAGSPQLYAYSVKQEPILALVSPGLFAPVCQSYAVEGYAGDPQTESANIKARDLTLANSRLTKRGEFSALLTTTYTPPGGSQKTVSLFRGLCIKPRSTRHGAGMSTYPAWRSYDLNLVGMWHRLSESVQPSFPRVYAIDPASPSLPWKVTDAVADVLRSCGFPPSQIAIANLPYRLWPGYSQKVDDLILSPATSKAEFAVRMIREYLGAYLHFEPNAGAKGQWILIFATQPGSGGSFTPAFNFVTTPTATVSAGHIPALYHPASYAAATSFMVEKPEYTINPPDFNAVWITTGVPTTNRDNRLQIACSAVNPVSFAVNGSTVTPDPNHPDYLGRCRQFVLVAPQLEGANNDATTFAVQWTCRRYYDFLCHAQRICSFRAPLALILDSSISSGSSGGYRPLRFQDPISIDGDASWLIKSVHMEWVVDGIQMARYEAIQPFAGQYFYGADGKEQRRREMRRMSQRTSGHGSHSAAFGAFAPSPHREQAHIELPIVRGGHVKIQDNTGAFLPIAGWNAWDQSTG